MSILIRGMEMPKSCGDCKFHWHGDGVTYCLALSKPHNLHHISCRCYYEAEEDCPLIEVPPHGRLIDADALRLLYDFNGYKPTGDMTEEEFDRLMCRLPVIRANIDDMPTIIPAEEEDND